MRRLRTILLGGLLIAAATSVAAADVGLALSPADNAHAAAPFRPATLAISNDTDHTLTEIRLRWQFGGPAFIYPITVAPRGDLSQPIRLAALAARQQYQAEFSFEGQSASDPIVTTAAIAWPEAAVNPGAFIHPAEYDRLRTIPAWSNSHRRRIILVAVAAGLLLAASMLLQRPGHRLGAAGLIIAAALAAVIAFAWSQPVVLEHLSEDGLLALTPRRTTTWQTSRADLQPIYASRQQMMEDTTAISPDGISVQLTPPRRQLFRQITPLP